MSHPPIPAPQPHTDGDDPRTQSILLPPSQRQAEDAVPAGAPASAPSAPGTAQFEQPGSAPQAGHAPQPGYDPTGAQVTGPVGFVPGFPTDAPQTNPGGGSSAAPTPPGPQPQADPPAALRRSPLAALRGGARSAVVPLVLGVVGLALLEVGLALEFGNQSLWDVVPTWSAFATVAALLVLVPAIAALSGRLPARTAWQVGAVGLAGLVATWVLVALPLAASDRGFWLTAAVAAAGAALWLAPGRTE